MSLASKQPSKPLSSNEHLSPALHSRTNSIKSRPVNADLEAVASPPPYRRRNAFVPGFHNPPPFLTFLRRDWYDIFTQLLCLTVAILLYVFVPPIMPRYFPYYEGVGQSTWGMKHNQPYISEYVSTIVSGIVSFAVPALIMGAASSFPRSQKGKAIANKQPML